MLDQDKDFLKFTTNKRKYSIISSLWHILFSISFLCNISTDTEA